MSRKLSNIFHRAAGTVVERTARVLSAPSRAVSRAKTRSADAKRKAIKISRENPKAPRDPKTKSGRTLLTADIIRRREQDKVKKRR